jgi:hypothetical protein
VVRGSDGDKLDSPQKLDLALPQNGKEMGVVEVLDAEEAEIDPFDYL